MKLANPKGEAAGTNKGVAIIGMSCLYPGAPDLPTFWSNIVRGVDATREVSQREWSIADYYDVDGQGRGLSYSKRGGFISEYADFDPLKFGIMPSAVDGGDPDQFLTLKVALAAMADAGYDGSSATRNFDRDRAEIILGRISAPGAGSVNFIQQSKTVHEIDSILKSVMPEQSDEMIAAVSKQVRERLVFPTADNIPGVMPNVLAGRLAAKLDFRGRNMIIDAACASSMVAVETAVNDLLDGRCDFALAGGVHVNASAYLFQMFCGLGALSHKDSIRPFDQEADGTLLGEGVGLICLKRFEDAIADGDRIYATIKGVASSSDGHGSSVLAPSIDGEALAMQKAYQMADISPSTIQLLEAHGTGTPTGDIVELAAIAKVFNSSGGAIEPWCAIGSVKSMIGHCQSASAIAGIIKSALALHHKILPPTLHVTKPNSKIDWASHPCYVNSQTRPWIKAKNSRLPRRAAVSAFGFGGVNGHLILEEFAPHTENATDKIIVGETEQLESRSLDHVFDCEIFVFSALSPQELTGQLNAIKSTINANPNQNFKDLSYSVNCSEISPIIAIEKIAKTDSKIDSKTVSKKDKLYRLAVVASSSQDLLDKVDYCLPIVAGLSSYSSSLSSRAAAAQKAEIDRGIYFTVPGDLLGGKLAFLYPGLGSAYTNMLADLCMHFPEVREVFEIVDNVALSAGAPEPPSKTIFPAPFERGERTLPTLLGTADFAVVAVLLAEYAIFQLLMHLEVNPDVLMGCSTGEFAAITTTGSVDVLSVAKTFYQLSTRVARSIPEESLANLRTLRVLSSWAKVAPLAEGALYLSADLGLDHIIVTGATEVISALTRRLKEVRVGSHLLPVPIPYHTPLVASIIDANNEAVQAVDIQPLAVPGWSCSTAAKYPQDVESMRASFVELFTKPINLRQTVQAMYDDGVRIFVEVGPNGILTSSISGILGNEPHLALPTNLANRSGVTQIQHLLAQLYVQGVSSNLAFLYKRRNPNKVDWLSGVSKVKAKPKLLSTTHTALGVDATALPEVVWRYAGDDSGVNGSQHYEYDEPLGLSEEQVASGEDEVIETFLATNSSFYSRLSSLSEQLMQTYIDSSDFDDDGGGVKTALPRHKLDDSDNLAAERLMDPEVVAHLERPFLKRAKIFRTAGDTTMHLGFSLKNDLYLLDHAIGGLVSTVHKTKVHLVPLMVTLEIMAEAALAHLCGGVPVRVEQVKAFRRIVVDHKGLSVRAVAVGSGDRVHVTLTDEGQPTTIYAQADFIFANGYGNVSVSQRLMVSGKPPVRLAKKENLYGNAAGKMFHGPLMQAVQSLEQVGNRAVRGQASGQSGNNWMPDLLNPDFLLHPMLLDNASQFVLFYLYEKEMPATALLPFLIESIELLYPPEQLDESVHVSAILSTLTERATEASLEVLSQTDVGLKINGINSRRIIVSGLWEKFVYDPKHNFLGSVFSIDPSLAGRAVIIQADQAMLPEDEVVLEWCLDYLLTRSEQVQWNDKDKTKKRKIDWLLGRIAAKEAVRKLIKSSWGLSIGPHDLEIYSQPNGAPVVVLADEQMPEILISISHTEGLAFALACFGGSCKPGIDAEIIRGREPGFVTTFLKSHEIAYLDSLPRDLVNTEITRLWSTKEALFKSFGGSLEMSSFSLATEEPGFEAIMMTCPEAAVSLKAYLASTGNLVLAYTLGETAGTF